MTPSSLNSRHIAILEVIRDNPGATIRKIHQIFPDMNVHQITSVVNSLYAKGWLERDHSEKHFPAARIRCTYTANEKPRVMSNWRNVYLIPETTKELWERAIEEFWYMHPEIKSRLQAERRLKQILIKRQIDGKAS